MDEARCSLSEFAFEMELENSFFNLAGEGQQILKTEIRPHNSISYYTIPRAIFTFVPYAVPDYF
jgi:hypothetical protein